MGISAAAAAIVTSAPPAISYQGAAPTRIRGGSVMGAVNGMNAVTCASVPSGSELTAKARNSETMIVRVSGVVVAWSSSRRGTSAPRTAERAGVEGVAEHEPQQGQADGGQQVAVHVDRRRRRRSERRHDQQLAEPEQAEPDHLPASSSRGRIVESRISTTREAFSSTTPLATQKP